MQFVLTVLSLRAAFQVQRDSNWRSLRCGRQVSAYLVGQREVCRQRAVNIWLSSRWLAWSQLLPQRRRVCLMRHIACTLR